MLLNLPSDPSPTRWNPAFDPKVKDSPQYVISKNADWIEVGYALWNQISGMKSWDLLGSRTTFARNYPSAVVSAIPPPPAPNMSFTTCVAGELVNNFIGDDEQALVSVAVNIAPIVARRAAGVFLPGPGWLYTATAIVYDAVLVGKSVVSCKQ